MSIFTYIYICIYIHNVLLCFIDPRAGKIRNEASSCPGIFSRTLRFYYVASSPGSPLTLWVWRPPGKEKEEEEEEEEEKGGCWGVVIRTGKVWT